MSSTGGGQNGDGAGLSKVHINVFACGEFPGTKEGRQ